MEFFVFGPYVAGVQGAVTNFMCLFDEFLAWKKETSKPNEFEIYIYQDTEEIMDTDTAEFLNEKYTLHKQNNWLAEI